MKQHNAMRNVTLFDYRGDGSDISAYKAKRSYNFNGITSTVVLFQSFTSSTYNNDKRLNVSETTYV